ncbi:MAG: alpha/beta hydrolase [Planctomycetota bacterium]
MPNPNPTLALLISAMWFAVSLPASAEAPAPLRDQPYVDPATERQTLDFYPAAGLPDAEQPRPAIVFIHGGAWMKGDKQIAGRIADTFTDSGIHVVSMGYRLVPDVQWPENIRDVAAGVDWVMRHAESLDIDPQRITLMGHSAGAHLVALLGADARWLGEHDRNPADLHAVVLLDGAGYDIPLVVSDNTPVRARIYYQAFGDQPEDWIDASPARNVSPDGANCPTWLSIINDDWDASHQQSQTLFHALNHAGQPDTTLLPVKKSHRDVAWSLGNPDDPEALRIIELAKTASP